MSKTFTCVITALDEGYMIQVEAPEGVLEKHKPTSWKYAKGDYIAILNLLKDLTGTTLVDLQTYSSKKVTITVE